MKARILLLIGPLLSGPVALAEGTPPADAFVFTVQNRRDPFRPPEAALPEGPHKRTDRRVKEFLESLQLDSLKLVAILLKGTDQNPALPGGEPIAMMEDPEGAGHLVRVGHYIGVNEGRIVQIRDGEVVIEEPSQPGDPTATHTITLQLHKTEEPGRDNAQTGKKN